MNVLVLDTHGLEYALRANALSYSIGEPSTIERLRTLVKAGDSHAKVMRMVMVWLRIDAPRFWWSEFDTYKIGTVAMSESTMHTLAKGKLSPVDFEGEDVDPEYLSKINAKIKSKASIESIKKMLPESFLQCRIVMTDYQTLRHIYFDRRNHRLPQWKVFIQAVESVPYFAELVSVGG